MPTLLYGEYLINFRSLLLKKIERGIFHGPAAHRLAVKFGVVLAREFPSARLGASPAHP
jgi:hypothetical protein